MANGDGRAVDWRGLAVWAALALLALLGWVGNRELDRVDVRVGEVERAVDADHDDVVRLREVVPRVEAGLERLERQNAEILRRLQSDGGK